MQIASGAGNPGHYDKKYFEWQRDLGAFNALANQIKFLEFTSAEFKVLDFGCGGGFMLKSLPGKEKLGIEINASARDHARQNGLTVLANIEEVQDDWADLLISDHALEHTPDPLEQLKKLLGKLKSGGKAVFVVPAENIDMPFDKGDINQHLYSWGPQSLGNLFKLAGFTVESSKPFFHKHFPYCHHVRRLGGKSLFNGLCYLNGRLNWHRSNEVRIVASR